MSDEKLVYGSAALEDGLLVHRIAEVPGTPPTVCALHERVLGDVDEQLRFTPDAVEAEDAVRNLEAVAAFFLPPTDAARIRDVIDRGERLPPQIDVLLAQAAHGSRDPAARPRRARLTRALNPAARPARAS